MRQKLSERRIADRSADAANAPAVAADAAGLSLSESMAVFHAHVADAQHARNGRELTVFEAHPEKAGRMVDLLLAGNYRETAATIAGITPRALRLWMQKAEEGDSRYESFAQVVRVAEAIAESTSVQHVRSAGKDPRFWAADMTYLERRYPDRWGRRQDDASQPKVIVQIGVRDSDVTVNVSSPPEQPLREQ